jgi:CheY-like chemotaxis protein
MDPFPSPEPITDPEKLLEAFEELMPFRVRDILLVSSLYDSFILREDGRLNELLIGDSLELHLQHIPGITHVSSGPEAIALARSDARFNLIVTNLTVGAMGADELARQVKQAGLDVPVIVLAYDYRQIKDFVARNPVTDIERIFLWQGNVRILIALIKYIEDKRNVLHDTSVMGVPVILLVEDNIRYCSSFLPMIYTELITQSRSLFSEGLNVAHKLVRMRARPKILLCSNYEDAAEQALAYREYLFGVVSDVEFPLGGKLTPDAGFELANLVRTLAPDVPIVLQSSRTKFMTRAHAEGYSFLRKRSPTMLGDFRRLLTEQFAFGDFVFRRPDRSEVARATDLNSLEKLLHQVPAECLAYHSERNHFSRWLRARTEFALAQKLRPRKVSDFATLAALRQDIIDSIAEYRHEQRQALIGDFSPSAFQPNDRFFLRIGGGSLGGKARGLAFVRHLFRERQVGARFAGVQIAVPSTLVLATDVSWRPCCRPRCARVCWLSSPSCTTLWRCAPPVCSKTRNISPSPGSTKLSCSPTSTPISRRASTSCAKPSSGSTPPPSASAPRPTCGPHPTGWKRKKWRSSSSKWWAQFTASVSIRTFREWRDRRISTRSLP